MNGKPWTGRDLQLLREEYPHVPTERIAKRLGRSLSAIYGHAYELGLHKSAAYLASPDACRLRRGDKVGLAFRYAKAHVPANKGLRRPGWAPGRMSETQFKQGQRTGSAAANWRPIGTVLTDADGYLRIKVREHKAGEHSGFGNTKIWALMQRRVWEIERGPIPAGHVVVFRDGDRKNCDIANLECISRGDLMRRNTIHNLPPALKEVIYLKGCIRATVTKRRKKAA